MCCVLNQPDVFSPSLPLGHGHFFEAVMQPQSHCGTSLKDQ